MIVKRQISWSRALDMDSTWVTLDQLKDSADNIPFTVGDRFELWSKIMEEVKLGRFAGPFESVPFKNFVQSPVGLVPKHGGKTRLIFHLSYQFKNGNQSINFWTPDELCTVKYNDLDHAVKNSIKVSKRGKLPLFYSKTDLKSAFRILPLKPSQIFLLCIRVEHPVTRKPTIFFDKNLPFGASISCCHFQRVSNSLRHIWEVKTGRFWHCTNYLDDYIFLHNSKEECDKMVRCFLNICKAIWFPVALEKTEWSRNRIVFLGILLDGLSHSLSVPEDKRFKALYQVNQFADRRKATVKELQSLAGTLNFLNRAVYPGRSFTRRMYTKFSGGTTMDTNKDKILGQSGNFNENMTWPHEHKRAKTKVLTNLKPYHPVRLEAEFKNDCRVWSVFLQHVSAVSRPFIDFTSNTFQAQDLNFYTDASTLIGFGGFSAESGFLGHGINDGKTNTTLALLTSSYLLSQWDCLLGGGTSPI